MIKIDDYGNCEELDKILDDTHYYKIRDVAKEIYLDGDFNLQQLLSIVEVMKEIQ